MPGESKATADMAAWKGDVQYKIDGDLLRDLRFGARVTTRSTTNVTASGTTWYSLSQPWSVKQTSVPGQLPGVNDPQGWQSRGTFGYLNDPRYAALVPTQTVAFTNFFNGKVGPAPALVMPSMGLVKADPRSYQSLLPILQMECQDGNTLYGTNNDCSTAGSDWKPLTYDGDPANTDRIKEQTQAVYGTLRFGADGMLFPTEGNVGLRVVHTRTSVDGYTVFTPPGNPPPDAPLFDPINAPRLVTHSYFDFLPSLNLKTELTSKLQARLALSRAMYRPNFSDLRAYETLNQNITTTNNAISDITYNGRANGNPDLKPIRANNYDLSLEWYPRNSSSLTADVFYKQVKDIILQSAHVESFKDAAGNPQGFLVAAPDNVADGTVGGLEIAGQTYFDGLPGLGNLPDWLKGFGISANYTYIHSAQTLHHPFSLPYCPSSSAFNNGNLSLFGCDTNGMPFGSMPIQYLSKNAVNVAFLYDAGPLSARLAYNWRSRFLQGVNVNGTQGSDGTSADPARNGAHDVGWGLPTWQEAYGQWDAGVDYKVTDELMLSLSATNLTDGVVRQTQQQHIGDMGREWFEPGRILKVSARYDF
jgi:TonB-dependent receptor